MKPLPLHEREYRESLYRLERRAIIPLKWGILFVSLVLWLGVIDSPLTTGPFALFLGYFLFNSTLTYFFYFSAVTSNQIRPLTLISYLSDVVFVTMLIYFDLATLHFGTRTHSEFYMIYFLLVMRGFALFKSIAETIFVNLLISIVYILTFYLQHLNFTFLLDSHFAVSLILIWLVVLMSWFIIMIINRQKIELMEMHERLLRSDSLARIGELAAGVAHEINNPIGIIAMTAEYIKASTPAEDPHHEDIDAIHKEAMRCKQIVKEMMTYAHPRPVGLVTLEPCAINDEVLAFVFPKSRAGSVEIVREYAPDVPPINADPNLIKQALLNLYLNARQAIPETRPGRIVSRIRPAGSGFGKLRGTRRVVIEVEDNGTGIAEADVDFIFDPFFTRKPQGTGLGLAVTQRIVEKFGGAIAVRPAPEQGTIFSIEFPAV